MIYFNPSDTGWPIAFNVMENVEAEQRHLIASGLLGVFKKIWPDVWSPRMEYILNNTVLALLEYPNSTLLGINRMLSDKEYRKKVVENVTDPVIKAFWTQEFAKYTDRFTAEATPAIQNKVGQFISNPLIRNIIGQPKSAFDMRKIMDEKKILIMNLSKGKIGEENSRLIGAMLITKLYLAAMSRVDTPEEERNDFYLYVDEFQNFATDSFASILSEARKYRMSLTLAHQYIGQLITEISTRVRDAVFGNVGTIIIFRVGASDAEFLEKEFAPEFSIDDMVNLGFANIYLKLMIDGVSSRPFSATTLPPIKKQEVSYRDEIINISRKNYAVAASVVEEEISKWQAPIEEEKKTVSGSGKGLDVKSEESPKPKLYEAVCDVCGKKTLVPFQPDGKRPVYCKTHRKVASQDVQPRQKATPKDYPILQKGELVTKKIESQKTISLRELQTHKRPKRASPDLTALREALKEALGNVKQDGEQDGEKDGEKEKISNHNKSGTLNPGDSVKF